MKTKTAVTVLAVMISTCIAFQQTDARAANGLHFSSKLHVGEIKAARGSTMRLASMKLRSSSPGSTLRMSTRARLNGTLTMKKGATLQVASLDMNNARIGGPADLQMNVQVQREIIGDQDSEISIGGMQITADENYNPQNFSASGAATASQPLHPSQPVNNSGILANLPGGTLGNGQLPGPTVRKQLPVISAAPASTNGKDLQKIFSDRYPQGYHFKGADYNHIYGHCAWFAEQLTRLPNGRKWTIGNTVADKRVKLAAHVKNGNGFYRGKGTPKAGNAVIFSGGKWGHVAVINKVLPDGRLRLTESNRKGDFHVTHDRVISPNDQKIMGFLRTRPVGG